MTHPETPDADASSAGPPIEPMIEALKELTGDAGELSDSTRLFRAPGRVNLMGDHTDYNGGLVLPAAIDYETRILCTPGDRVRLRSLDVDGLVETGHKGGQFGADWGKYIAGILAELADLGRKPVGLTGVIDSTVPVGRGLSSSAALEVAFATAACGAAGFEINRLQLADACRRAEERVAGVECGIMDQAVAVLGVANAAILLDCSTLVHRVVPIPAWLSIIAVDSGVERSLAGSSYNRRRQECGEALSAIQAYMGDIETLSDINVGDLDEATSYLDKLHSRRVRHVVTENERVRRLAEVLTGSGSDPDDAAAGKLRSIFAASQASLVDDYEAGHPDTNKLVEISMNLEGCLGARQTGAGWGGSVAVLATAGKARELATAICRDYANATNKQAHALICTPAAGASEITLDSRESKPLQGGAA